MGILNCTPDSFHAASRVQTEEQIARRANDIVRQGGAIIDVGAMSTRPGSEPVSIAEEMRRLRLALPIVRREQPDAIISVDTCRQDVARMAVEEYGADIINDVSGGAAALAGVPYILMSSEADMASTKTFFERRISELRDGGVEDIILDPGYGFGKTMATNLSMVHRQDELLTFGLPVLTGISRKRMIWQTLGTSPEEALNGTTALHAIAIDRGAAILRVHDVREAVEVCKLVGELFRAVRLGKVENGKCKVENGKL